MSAAVVTRASTPRIVPKADALYVPVAGTEFWLDDEISRAELARAAPEIDQDLAEAPLEGRDLDAAVQTELARLGCYRDRIDGAFGRNSRFALTSYYLAKGVLFDDLETSPALLRQLELEPNVVCTGTQTRAPKRLERVAAAEPAVAPSRPRQATKEISREREDAIESGRSLIGIRGLR